MNAVIGFLPYEVDIPEFSSYGNFFNHYYFARFDLWKFHSGFDLKGAENPSQSAPFVN